MSLFDLSGRVCAVTGSTKGMGRAMVERLAEQGASVVVCSRQEADARALARDLCGRYGSDRAVHATFDLEDVASLQAPVEAALQAWGRLDTLVSNAAVVVHGGFNRADDDGLDRSLRANVRNNAILARAALPPMLAQGGGSLVFVLSTVGLFPSPPYFSYSLAKAALAHMTRILAVDLGPRNIRVNGIVPGLIKTAATADFSRDPAKVRTALGRNPLGRMGEADEIAAAAVLLASPGGGYINGHLLVVDGGQIHQGREAARDLAEQARV